MKKRDKFIQKVKVVHQDKYDYTLVDYVDSQTKVEIICPEHGMFSQVPANHSRGYSCPDCAKTKKSTTEEFIKKAVKIHGNNYIYDDVIYINNKQDVIITCFNCGLTFSQTPNMHLSQKQGCSQCAIQKHAGGWRMSDWLKAGKNSKKFTGFKVYMVNLFDDNEDFIKIGRTFLPVTYRFWENKVPYHYKILNVISGEGEEMYKLEITLHKLNRAFRYVPKKHFQGHTECYSKFYINN